MPFDRIVAELTRNLDLLASRLRDLPPRQRSILAVYDYIWTLLTAEEKASLAALAVFRDGWDETAAVAGDGAAVGVQHYHSSPHPAKTTATFYEQMRPS
jgi:predicted ATPase